ncbi:MAG TPA: hypothetical protein VJ835_07835 [Fimbriimonadaceae bacterium]|nr:hypothetical protein [Fimbriimonadaceae bacterium]
MAGLLIVRGDEDRVPFSNLAFGFTLGTRPGTLMVKPTTEELRTALLEADEFFFYGHGDKNGALHLGNHQFFRQSDLDWVIEERARRGKPKLKVAEVRACYGGSKAEYVNRWLNAADEVHCFPNVTASPMPPFVHPMHSYHHPIDRDPGARGFWSRLRRGGN